MNLEYKFVSFKATNVTQEERNKVPVGIIEGYAATWDIDRGDDEITQGAFAKSIARHKKNDRQVRMYFGHNNGRLIGGFPISYVKEDNNGLFVRGEVNLESPDGKSSYSLAKQGVLTDMSIGFSVPDRKTITDKVVMGKKVRVLNEVELWEISLVPEPMNANAKILAVKSVTPFEDLPLVARESEWDAEAAVERIKAATGSIDGPSADYKKAFLWYDVANRDDFKAYRMPFVDVDSDGNLKAVPKAIFTAASMLRGFKDSIDIPDDDKGGIETNINQYYAKMDLESPFNEKSIDITIVECCNTIKDVEQFLKHLGLTDNGRKTLISKIKSLRREGGSDGALKSLKEKADELEFAAHSFLLSSLTEPIR